MGAHHMLPLPDGYVLRLTIDPVKLDKIGWDEKTGSLHIAFHKKGGGWYITEDLSKYTANVFIILGIVFGSIALLLLIVFVLCWCFTKSNNDDTVGEGVD